MGSAPAKPKRQRLFHALSYAVDCYLSIGVTKTLHNTPSVECDAGTASTGIPSRSQVIHRSSPKCIFTPVSRGTCLTGMLFARESALVPLRHSDEAHRVLACVHLIQDRNGQRRKISSKGSNNLQQCDRGNRMHIAVPQAGWKSSCGI